MVSELCHYLNLIHVAFKALGGDAESHLFISKQGSRHTLGLAKKTCDDDGDDEEEEDALSVCSMR